MKTFPKAILVLTNHFSWWDAFFMIYVNTRLFKKKYFVMMLEEQLRKFILFKYGGSYSVKKNSRDILESLHFTIQLLQEPGNIVQLFPQGMIQSQHEPEIRFESGIGYVLQHAAADYQLLFSVALTDYFSSKKPQLHIFLEECPIPKASELVNIEKSFNDFYKQCKLRMINQHTR